MHRRRRGISAKSAGYVGLGRDDCDAERELGVVDPVVHLAWGEVMAYLSLITVPVLVFYLLLQRAFIDSIAASGVKG